MKPEKLSFTFSSSSGGRSEGAQVPSGNKYPKREFRGAWIQAVNGQFRGIPTERLKQILISQLNSLQEAGINAIIFQVRPEADALYASQHEPWSRFLTGTQGQMPSPMWDPMQFMIEECQKRNMEFHAWINPYRVKTSLKNKLARSIFITSIRNGLLLMAISYISIRHFPKAGSISVKL